AVGQPIMDLVRDPVADEIESGRAATQNKNGRRQKPAADSCGFAIYVTPHRVSGRAASIRPACLLVGGAAVLHQRETLQQVERTRELIVLLRIGDGDLLRADMGLLLRLVDIG